MPLLGQRGLINGKRSDLQEVAFWPQGFSSFYGFFFPSSFGTRHSEHLHTHRLQAFSTWTIHPSDFVDVTTWTLRTSVKAPPSGACDVPIQLIQRNQATKGPQTVTRLEYIYIYHQHPSTLFPPWILLPASGGGPSPYPLKEP